MTVRYAGPVLRIVRPAPLGGGAASQWRPGPGRGPAPPARSDLTALPAEFPGLRRLDVVLQHHGCADGEFCIDGGVYGGPDAVHRPGALVPGAVELGSSMSPLR